MDLSLPWGSDLAIGPNGDFKGVTDDAATKERIVRRLLTNPIGLDSNGTEVAECDYHFHPNYGAGTRRYVHGVITQELQQTVQQRVTDQALQEPSVVATPAPVVNVTKTLDGFGLAIDASVSTVTGGIVTIPTIAVTL